MQLVGFYYKKIFTVYFATADGIQYTDEAEVI